MSRVPEAIGSRRLRIAYVARQDGTDIRICKEIRSLEAAGFEVALVGWDRSPNAESTNPGYSEMTRFLYRKATGYGPKNVMTGSLGFAMHVRRTLAAYRPDILHCVNEDLTILGLILRPSSKVLLVCDLFDSVLLRWSSAPKLLAWFAKFVAFQAQLLSDLVLVTDERRAKLASADSCKLFVVPNYPSRELLSLPDVKLCTNNVYLFISGSINRHRGTGLILKLLENRPSLRVIAAGWLQDESAVQLSAHERVEFAGVVSPEDAARLCRSCHAMVLLYDPVNLNNIYASPNKLYDAIVAGRPVIANEELAVAPWIIKNGIGYTIPYGDIRAIETVVDLLAKELTEPTGRRWPLSPTFVEQFTWDVSAEMLLKGYRSLLGHGRSPSGLSGRQIVCDP